MTLRRRKNFCENNTKKGTGHKFPARTLLQFFAAKNNKGAGGNCPTVHKRNVKVRTAL